MSMLQGVRDKLGWLQGVGYVDRWHDYIVTLDSGPAVFVVITPDGGVEGTYTVDQAYLYTSGMLIGAQGREKARPDHRVLVSTGVLPGQIND